MYDHLCSKAEDTTKYGNTQHLKMNVQLSKAVAGHSPVLASAHENGCICLWSIQVTIGMSLGWDCAIQKVIPLSFGNMLFN